MKIDIQRQIKVEFSNNKHVVDAVSLRSIMAEGSRQLEVLKDMAASSQPTVLNQQVHGGGPQVTSWLDSSTPDDVKGRVGEGWPWQ